MAAVTAEGWLGSLLGKVERGDPVTGWAETTMRGRVSLDDLANRMETARRNMEAAEAKAKDARDAAEGYRDAFEVARDELVAAIKALDLYPEDGAT